MAIQASGGSQTNPTGRRQEAAPGWGGACAGAGTSGTLADDPFHDDWAHWPAEQQPMASFGIAPMASFGGMSPFDRLEQLPPAVRRPAAGEGHGGW